MSILTFAETLCGGFKTTPAMRFLYAAGLPNVCSWIMDRRDSSIRNSLELMQWVAPNQPKILELLRRKPSSLWLAPWTAPGTNRSQHHKKAPKQLPGRPFTTAMHFTPKLEVASAEGTGLNKTYPAVQLTLRGTTRFYRRNPSKHGGSPH